MVIWMRCPECHSESIGVIDDNPRSINHKINLWVCLDCGLEFTFLEEEDEEYEYNEDYIEE